MILSLHTLASTVLTKQMDVAGASCVKAKCASFVETDPHDPLYSSVTHILLDPSVRKIVARFFKITR